MQQSNVQVADRAQTSQDALRPATRRVRIRNTPTAEAAIWRELLFRERAKQGASNQPREALGARGTRSGCQLMGSACSSGTSVAVKAATADSRHTPSSRGRGPLPSGHGLFVEEPEALNDLDVDVVGSSTSPQLHHCNITTSQKVPHQGGPGQDTGGLGRDTGGPGQDSIYLGERTRDPGQGTRDLGQRNRDLRQRNRDPGQGNPGQGTRDPGQGTRDPGQVNPEQRTGQGTRDPGQRRTGSASKMATGSETTSDAALAQLLQGDEYNKAPNQRCGRVPSDYELAKQVQVQTDAEIAMHMQANVHRRHSNGHCHHDSNGGHRWVEERGGRVPTPSDYVLAKHVQEQEDAEIAMNVQARDVQSTEGNAYPDHDSSYHDHNSSSHNSNGVFSNGGHRWMEEGGGHAMLAQLLQSESSQYNEVRGGPGSSSGCGPGSSDYEIAKRVQEQVDAEEALRVQAREMQSASHRLEEGERPLLPQAAHNSHSMQQQAAQQMDLTYESLLELEDVSNGVDPPTLDSLTSTHAYTERPGASEESRVCAVCKMEYSSGDALRTLPCLHSFHSDCVDQWLAGHTQCPVCMKDIKEHTSPVGALINL